MKVTKKLYFDCNSKDIENLESVFKKYPKNAEEIINNYLQETGVNELVSKTTFYIPISAAKSRRMYHAKNNKWYEISFKNLEIDLFNRVKGTKNNSYYYLYYVANYSGTSDPRKQNTGVGGIDFFTDGAEVAYPIIKENLLDLLSKKIKEEL